MDLDSNLQPFVERCLRMVGLGPIFRLVIKHDADLDIRGFATTIMKPMAEELEFVCQIVDLSTLVTKLEATIEFNEIKALLDFCGDEQRPLLIIQNTELLLKSHFDVFHTQLRSHLDWFDTTAVIFLSSDKESVDRLFTDCTMPFYCSAMRVELTD